MGARVKLNMAYYWGGLILAGFVGGIANSGLIFVLAMIALLGIAIASDDIRFQPPHH